MGLRERGRWVNLKFLAAFALRPLAGRWPAGPRRWQRRQHFPHPPFPSQGSLSLFLRVMLSLRSVAVLGFTVQNVLGEEVEAALQ